MSKIYNYLGRDLTGVKLQLNNSKYGYIDDKNIPHIDWGKADEECDENGFDKTYRPFEGEDKYIVENYVIPRGTMLCRYGFPGGLFTTIKGTNYDSLGLPYLKDTVEYHEYKVSEDVYVKCCVTKGRVASKFGSEGGAVQFMHKQTLFLECEDGYLQEDIRWRQRNI